MPVLAKTATTKRIMLPNSSKPEDEAWVDVVDEVRMELIYDLDLEAEQKAVTLQLLSRIVKGWNFTDEDGKELPVTEENLKLLPVADIVHITQESGLNDKFEALSKQKKSE